MEEFLRYYFKRRGETFLNYTVGNDGILVSILKDHQVYFWYYKTHWVNEEAKKYYLKQKLEKE